MDDLIQRTLELPLSEVVIREDLYPRMRVEPTKIEEYALAIDLLPPIEVNQNNILIDGMHRLRAHEAAKRVSVPVRITQTKSDDDIFFLAIARNAKHGLILSQDDKRKLAVKFCDLGRDRDEVCGALAISRQTWDLWTTAIRERQKEERRETILDMHLRCHTQAEIAESVGTSQPEVNSEISDFIRSANFSDADIFRNFEHEDSDKSGRRVYDVWNFSKADNEVRHFGNIPPQIVDNLLYLYTKPFDVVFDPFGGGDSRPNAI